MIGTKLNISLQDSTSTANKLSDAPVADSVVRAGKKDTEQPGSYWEKFRQRQGGASQSQPQSHSQGQPQSQSQTELQQPYSQPTAASESQPIAKEDDFVHPSRKAANFGAVKARQSKRPGRAVREAAKDGRIKIPGWEPRADKVRPPALSDDDAEHEPTLVSRGTDSREDSHRRPSFDGRRDASFDDPYRRSPPRGGERGFTPGNRRQRAGSHDRKEAQGGASQAPGYVHPNRMALVSPAREPARDSRPQGRNKNERPAASEDRRKPRTERKTVLSAADGHQWASSGNDIARGPGRGRGRGRGRGGNHRGGRGRGRAFGEGNRYVPPPPPSWSDSQFDQIYRRR
jgi:hypothetical protein